MMSQRDRVGLNPVYRFVCCLMRLLILGFRRWATLDPCQRSGTCELGSTHPTFTRRKAMNANKALWEKGDFTRIAESMRESGEALVGELGVTEGLQVLDLGCGDGTTA